ncbi:MAG: histidine phosphatase family protein, partial [Candidatus Omnitrophica bacterium]|nr:histidine phosphatase family protein [Candidatus Omnitrophota bacterium]
EIGLGEWENKTPDEINGLYDSKFKRWLRFGPSKIDIPGSEPVAHFRKRVDRQFAEIIKENIEKDNIVVVTHGGVISSFLAGLIDADFDKIILRLNLPNACVMHVSCLKGKAGIVNSIWPAR